MKTDQKKWFCKQCSLKFNSSSIYSLHLKLVHKNRIVTAAIRNEEVIKESDETKNKFAVIPDFGKEKAIVQPGKKTFKCEFCDYSSTKEHLNRHISSVHEGKKPFKCEICNKSFSTKSYMKIHVVAVHERKRTFECKLCEYRCPQKSTLNRHV